MASHVFDYSGTPIGVTLEAYRLFGVLDGTLTPPDYWTGTGTLRTPITYLVPDGGLTSSGTPTYQLIRAEVHLPSTGNANYFDPAEVSRDFFYGTFEADAVPDSYGANPDKLSLDWVYSSSNSGSFLRFEEVAAPARAFPPGIRDFGPDADVGGAVTAMGLGADAAYLSALQALMARPLADAGPITAEQWFAGALADRTRLTYTPDPGTALTLGDLLLIDPQELGTPYAPQMAWTDTLFGGEDVRLILTARDDYWNDTSAGFGFAARLLHVDAGGGDDAISIGPTSAGTFDPDDYPRMVLLDGEAGNDALHVTAAGDATLRGGIGNDSLTVSGFEEHVAGRVELWGNAGDDDLRNYGSAARLWGGAGDDFLVSYAGADSLYGGDGNDNLGDDVEFDSFTRMSTLFEAPNLIDGGAGDDTLTGGGGDDTLLGGDGADHLMGLTGDDVLTGGAGLDAYYLWRHPSATSAGSDTIRDDGGVVFLEASDFPSERIDYVRQDDDLLFGNIGTSAHRIVDFYLHSDRWLNGRLDFDGTIIATRAGAIDWDAAAAVARPAVPRPTPEGDRLSGGGGPDAISGLAGDDTIRGGAGNDTLAGDGGDDEILGDDGNDMLSGGRGDDTLSGGAGNDTLDGGSGKDRMSGGAGNDSYRVDVAGDRVIEGAGGGRDTVRATAEVTLDDAEVELILLEGTGALRVNGNGAATEIVGNSGANILIGGGGADTVTGGGGNDVFVFRPGDAPGAALLVDFGRGDRLALDDRFFGLGDTGIDPRSVTSDQASRALAAGTFSYDRSTGEVSIDPDGRQGPDAPAIIALIEGARPLAAEDVLLF
jgi:Ca2+-binding RTX toxin-like protein